MLTVPLASTPFATLPGLAALALAYLLGSVPLGLCIARMKGIDLRQVGSGNIGATNTMRALGKGWGLVSFAFDFAKGWMPVFWLAPRLVPDSQELQIACGAAAVLGHCFPLYLRFHGGKGVATGCGAIVGIDPVVFLIAGAVWLVTLALGRMVGLASLMMGLAFPLAAWWRHPDQTVFITGAGLLTLLIVVRHRTNVARILSGTEPRIGARPVKTETSDG